MDDAFFNATGESRRLSCSFSLSFSPSLSLSQPAALRAEACSAPMDIGPCYALKLRFFYNATGKTCQAFNYGGCAGNSNNFDTEKECLQRCRTEGEWQKTGVVRWVRSTALFFCL